MLNFSLLLYYAIFVIAVLRVGKFLTNLLQIQAHNRTEGVIFQLAFGSIFYSYVFHLLGMFNLLYGQLVLLSYWGVATLAIGEMLLHVSRLNFIKKISRKFWRKELKKQWLKIKLMDTRKILLVVALVFIFFPLIPYLFLYPAGWDVLAYHLALPKFYLSVHSLPFVNWFDQTGFPIGIEALFGYGEALHEPRLSNFIHFSYIIATVAYLLFGIKYLLNSLARYIATFLFLFQPMLYTEVALSAYVDYPFAFFSLITAILIFHFFQTKKMGTLIGIFVLLSFLPLIKFSGLLILVAVGILFGFHFLIEKLGKTKRQVFTHLNWKTSLLCLLPFLMPGYWLGRNWIASGNPFYPFYNSFFKGLGYEAGGKSLLKDDILHNSFVIQMIKNFINSADTPQDYTNLSAVGFVVVGTIAGIWFLRSKKIELRYFAVFHLLVLGLLMLTVGLITRYIFFIFPGFSILIAMMVTDWSQVLWKRRDFFPQLFHFVFVVALISVVFIQVDSTLLTRQKIFVNLPKRQWLYFLDSSTAQSMLYQQDNYRIHLYANTHLNPETDKVLQLLDNRIYYLDVPNAFANTISGAYFTDKKTKDAREVYTRIKEDGFTHAIKLNAWGPHPVMQQEIFNSFMENYVTPIATESGVTLYQIN